MNKLTVCVCYYNSENHIQNCLDSINRFYNDNADIIFVNDGSEDSSEKIIENFIKSSRYKNIKNINHGKNLGLPLARLTGIKNTKTEWMVFLDSDDELNDDIFSYINSVSFESDIDFIQFRSIDGDGKIGNQFIGIKNGRDYLNEFFRKEHSQVSLQIRIFKTALFYPSPFFSNVNHFDDNMSFPILVSRSKKILFIDKVFLKVNWTSNSITRNIRSLKELEKKKLYRVYYKNHYMHLKENLVDTFKDDYYLRYQIEMIFKFSFYSTSLNFYEFKKELDNLIIDINKVCFLNFRFCLIIKSKNSIVLSFLGLKKTSILFYFLGKLKI